MKRKILVLIAAVLVLVPAASASITGFNIVNVFPTPVIKMQDTDIVVRVETDSTTTTTARLFVEKPDKTLFLADEETLTVKSGSPREQILEIPQEDIDQFGNYRIIVNETDAGLQDTLNITLIPAPQVDIRTTGEALIQRGTGDSEEYVSIDINPRVGSPIRDDEIVAGNLSLYQVIDNGKDVQKNLRVSPNLVKNNETGDLESIIPLEGLEEDEYSLIVKFNITDCGVCMNFTEVESDSVRVREAQDIDEMAVQLSVLLALLFAGGLFAYTGFQMRPRNKKVAALRTMLIMAAPLFAVFAVGMAAIFAGIEGFGAANSIMWVAFLGTFILWFVMALVIGLLMYFTDALETGVTQGRREFDQEL